MPTDADLQAMQTMVAASVQSVVKELSKLTDKAKSATAPTGEVTALNSAFGGLARTLAGPVGVAAAIYAVAQSLENFSRGRVQLQNFATDVGATVRMINALQTSMEKQGISTNEAQGSIAKLGSALKNLAAVGPGSALDRLLRETNVPKAEREKLIEESRTDFDVAMKHAIELLNSGSKEMQIYRAGQLGLNQSHIQAMQNFSKELGKVFEGDLKAAREWLKGWVEIEIAIGNTLARIQDHFTKFLTGNRKPETEQTIKKFFEKLQEKDETGQPKGFQVPPTSFFGRMFDAETYKKLWNNVPSISGSDPIKGAAGIGSLANPLGLFTNAGGAALGVLGKASSFIFSPAAAAAGPSGQLIEIESDSNKLLRDIRNSLRDDEEHGGGGGGDAIGGRGGIYSRSGIGRASRGGGSVEGGGATFNERFTGKSEGSAPSDTNRYKDTGEAPVGTGKFDRSQFDEEIKNNPGLLERMQTIVQGEVGHGAPAWKKQLQLETIFNRAAARGQTLTQVTQQYTGPGSAGYYPSSTFSGGRIRSQEEFERFQQQVMGPVRAGSDVSTERLGFPATGNASAGVAARGAASGRYTRYGQTDPNAYPGKPGVETYVQEGNWGRGGRTREDIARLEATRIDRDRASRERAIIDSGSGAFGRDYNASMSATIDFKNMPSWVRSNVDSNGKFKDLRVTRQTAQDGAAGEAWGDNNRWSYE